MSETSLADRRRREASHKRSQIVRRTIAGLLLVIAGGIAWAVLQEPDEPLVAAAGGSQVGDSAPDFTVPILDGRTFTLSEHRGNPTIVFFMAYWCGTCIPEARALAQIYEEFETEVSIVVLDVDPTSTPQALAQFKENAGNPEYVWAFDAGQEVAMSYRILSLDTTLILDSNGIVSYRDSYPTPYKTLKEALSEIGVS